jgi:Phage tail tube, TTP, lambda-like
MAVIDNAFETKGTHVYFVAQDGTTIHAFSCPTGVTGLNGGTADTIDTTGAFRTNITGFADTGDVSLPFIFYDGSASHIAAKALHSSKAIRGWMVGLSDSTTAPTVIDSDGMLTPPSARSSFTFLASVSNMTFDVAVGDVVRGTMTLKPSGETTFTAGV